MRAGASVCHFGRMLFYVGGHDFYSQDYAQMSIERIDLSKNAAKFELFSIENMVWRARSAVKAINENDIMIMAGSKEMYSFNYCYEFVKVDLRNKDSRLQVYPLQSSFWVRSEMLREDKDSSITFVDDQNCVARLVRLNFNLKSIEVIQTLGLRDFRRNLYQSDGEDSEISMLEEGGEDE